MRIEGTLKTWNDDRGFGFIEPLNGGQEIFVHIKAWSSRSGRPALGQRVTFEVDIAPDGKKRARQVEIVRPSRQTTRQRDDTPAQWGTASLLILPAFFALFALVDFLWKIPGWVAGVYLGASVLCFIVYAHDKSAAAAKQWRVSEDSLLFCGLLGGWPGALLAQQILRHKSNKAAFLDKFWLTVIANILGLIALNAPLRASFLA